MVGKDGERLVPRQRLVPVLGSRARDEDDPGKGPVPVGHRQGSGQLETTAGVREAHILGHVGEGSPRRLRSILGPGHHGLRHSVRRPLQHQREGVRPLAPRPVHSAVVLQGALVAALDGGDDENQARAVHLDSGHGDPGGTLGRAVHGGREAVCTVADVDHQRKHLRPDVQVALPGADPGIVGLLAE